jgi:hypothetical protein
VIGSQWSVVSGRLVSCRLRLERQLGAIHRRADARIAIFFQQSELELIESRP